MSHSGFVEINDVAALDRFVAEANGGPAILFKHSNSCGVSARAHGEMSRLNQSVGLVVVQEPRDVSDEIERRYNTPHETPQTLIVRGNKVLWDASHYRVRAHAVEEALDSVRVVSASK